MSDPLFRGENENSSSRADVLYKTSNVVISCCFADDGKEMDKNDKRTCRACKAIVFGHLMFKFVTFSLTSPLSLLKLPKGRFTRYDFVACEKLTTGLRHDFTIVAAF